MEILAGLLIGLALLVPLWRWASAVKRSGTSISMTGFDEIMTLFHTAKRVQLEQRQTESMLRDDTTDGAPPATRIDLVGGTAVIRIPDRAPDRVPDRRTRRNACGGPRED
ncbi:DUF6191 domain-containing protein [Streptomyces sp. H27-D2]|uniref:DUF6191 domain-containing protein n=1 Tax=Streptomyces sp. H27-D2 TaxID=3046304 RepID=UPI002DBCF543|nr:DUF6191 domain-containing protein [Streptomyces sp. H27-D2]MEC4015494.1 DUF6191 domain-containing protein [Streptomyces sp. H27-D2]